MDAARLAQPKALWADPADATAAPVEVALDPGGALATPGRNSAGGEDWLLVLQRQP